MKRILVITLLAAAPASAQNPDIVIDGVFDDWNGRAPIYSDSQDQPSNQIDFGRLWVDNDDRFVFFSIEVGLEEISLQNQASISLYLDTDNDPATGQAVAGIGAELTWIFGSLTGTYNVRQGATVIQHRHIGLLQAPTVTSDRFEFGLDLHADPFRLGPLFPGDTVAIVLEATEGGDVLPGPGEKVTFTIDRLAEERTYSYDLAREAESDLRILSWNVERDGFFEEGRSNAYRRILNAVNPDIIGFSEIYEHSVQQTLDRLELLLPSGPGEQWYGSGSSWDIVVASRHPINRSFDLTNGNAGACLIDVAGGLDRELLLVVAHLKCCGTPNDDVIRQRQIDEVMAFIRDAKDNGTLALNTPIVVAGDMNFVGDSQQPATLTHGEIQDPRFRPAFDPDWDGTPFADAMPMTTGTPAAFTWPGTVEAFSPSRLDYVVYSNFVLDLGNAFSLHTRELPLGEAQRLGLSRSDSNIASDHLPIVTDFRASSTTSTERNASQPPTRQLTMLAIYPNPASDQVRVEFESETPGGSIALFDVLGRRVSGTRSPAIVRGQNAIDFSVDGLPPGLYLVEITSDAGSAVRAVIVSGR